VLPSACQRDRNAKHQLPIEGTVTQSPGPNWKADEKNWAKSTNLGGQNVNYPLHRFASWPKAERAGWQHARFRTLTCVFEKHKKSSIPMEGKESLYFPIAKLTAIRRLSLPETFIHFCLGLSLNPEHSNSLQCWGSQLSCSQQ
jgi:hypothetical protein